MHVGIDVSCMHTNFGGRDSFTFHDMATFQKWANFPFGAWTIVHDNGKNLIDRNWLKKFMQVGVDVTLMRTSFGGCDLPVPEIWLPFKNGQISLSGHGHSP